MDAFAYGVVIPTHNRRDLVLQAIESVWAQTCPPQEVVVVVDGDVDGTADAVQAAYPPTRVVTLDGNTGAAGARNAGVAEISSPWVAFLDDDDLWHCRKQEVLQQYVEEHPTCMAVRPEFWLFHGPGVEPGGAYGLVPELEGSTRIELEERASTATTRNDLRYLDIEGRSLALMLERNRGSISGSMVRRDVLDRLPAVPDDLRMGEDWLLLVHVAAVTEWHLVPERLVFTRLHDSQITRSSRSMAPEFVTTVLQDVWGRYGDRPGICLEEYGPEYRRMIQGWVWSRLNDRDVRGALSAYRGARHFVPRATDRLKVWTPPQVTWRVDRVRRQIHCRHGR